MSDARSVSMCFIIKSSNFVPFAPDKRDDDICYRLFYLAVGREQPYGGSSEERAESEGLLQKE